MKRILTATLAALTFAAPLATTAAFADPPGRYDNDRGRDNYRGRDNDRRDNDRRDNNRRDNDRRSDRWDNRSHNGYTYQGRWYYGPPPQAYVGRAGYQPGYHAWRRGDRLPSYYRSQYRQVDYRREHLRAPPRGYHYVEDNRGDMLLVGVATGVILSVILANN